MLDMRDPWIHEPYEAISDGLRRHIETWIEWWVLKSCRACIFANRSIETYARAHPRWRNKFHYISNGYDSADFACTEPLKFDKYTIVHNGHFLPGYRTADVFLLALREVLKDKSDLTRQLQVLLIGRSGDEKKLIDALELGSVVNSIDYLPHKESLNYLMGADLLLLIGGSHRWEETGKIYEYLATGKPILALVRPDGAAAELLQELPRVRVVDRLNVVDTAAALKEMIAIESSDRVTKATQSQNCTSKWERINLTRELNRVLNDCLIRHEP